MACESISDIESQEDFGLLGQPPTLKMPSLLHRFSRIKPIKPSSAASSSSKLIRSLKTQDLVGFGLGCTVGAGIFVSLGSAARLTGVNSLFLSFLVAALGCCGSGLAYAEMATRVADAGSAYSYVYRVFGECAAF